VLRRPPEVGWCRCRRIRLGRRCDTCAEVGVRRQLVRLWVLRLVLQLRQSQCRIEDVMGLSWRCLWCGWCSASTAAARWPLSRWWSGKRNVLGREHVLVASTRRSGCGCCNRSWCRHKSEGPSIPRRDILVLARSSSPIQTDGIIARLAALDTVGACWLLLAALDLPRLARPAPGATALLRLGAAIFLRARHLVLVGVYRSRLRRRLLRRPRTWRRCIPHSSSVPHCRCSPITTS